MYLAETYNNYYRETKQSLYSSKKVIFPKPELYVIYTGEKENKKDVISLSEEFLNGESCSLEIKVKVLHDGKHGDIINQYVKFTKIYQEQIKQHGRTRKAVLETIKICKNEDVLKEYLEKRESEVVTIMMTLFDTEYIFNTYVEDLERNAEKKGEKKGEIKGAIYSMIETCQELGETLEDTIKRVAKKFNLSQSEAEAKVKEHWKSENLSEVL
jgi:hypothetical protein